MKFILMLACTATLMFSGCESEKVNPIVNPGDQQTEVVPSGDNKPVAPETYTYGNSDKKDPQLPKQEPWWKGN